MISQSMMDRFTASLLIQRGFCFGNFKSLTCSRPAEPDNGILWVEELRDSSNPTANLSGRANP
jgi:hypothetical protein